MKKCILTLVVIIYVTAGVCDFAFADKIKLPSITKVQALDVAKNYIEEYEEEYYGSIDKDKGYTISYNKSVPYGYNIKFTRIINDIPYGNDGISMFVDAMTGTVSNFYCHIDDELQVESGEIIDIGAANDIYKKALGVELRYSKRVTDEGIEAYLTYNASDDVMINAITGNTIQSSYKIPSDGYFDIMYMAEKAYGFFNPKSGLLTISQADDIIREIEEFAITGEYKIISADYLEALDNTGIITIVYKNGIYEKTVSLNANTGVPIEYIDNGYTLYNKTVGNGYEYAYDFAKKYYSEFIGNATLYSNKNDNHTVVLYERTVNGISYKSNGLYLCFDSNDSLKRLSFAWDNIDFPSYDDVISIDEAYDIIRKKCPLELSYHKRDNGKITPVYKKGDKGTGILNALTGKQITYDKSIYNSPKTLNYLDINTHYSSEIAKKLSDCDIYVSSGNVLLGDYISQEEFLLLLTEVINGTKPIFNTTGILTDDQREMLYSYMYSENVIKKSETNYTSYITRADAVKYLLNTIGYGTVGSMHDIFVSHFDDNDKIPKDYLGYIELARSLGIVSGDEYNHFNPTEYITNGDSLIMIYNYLSR